MFFEYIKIYKQLDYVKCQRLMTGNVAKLFTRCNKIKTKALLSMMVVMYLYSSYNLFIIGNAVIMHFIISNQHFT